MPKNRPAIRPLLTRTGNDQTDRNMRRVVKELDQLSPTAVGQVVSTSLKTGTNYIRSPLKVPRGASIVEQSVAGAISSLGRYKGDGALKGTWVFESAVDCDVKIAFH